MKTLIFIIINLLFLSNTFGQISFNKYELYKTRKDTTEEWKSIRGENWFFEGKSMEDSIYFTKIPSEEANFIFENNGKLEIEGCYISCGKYTCSYYGTWKETYEGYLKIEYYDFYEKQNRTYQYKIDTIIKDSLLLLTKPNYYIPLCDSTNFYAFDTLELNYEIAMYSDEDTCIAIEKLIKEFENYSLIGYGENIFIRFSDDSFNYTNIDFVKKTIQEVQLKLSDFKNLKYDKIAIYDRLELMATFDMNDNVYEYYTKNKWKKKKIKLQYLTNAM